MSTATKKKDSPKPVDPAVVPEGKSEAFIPYPPIGENLEHIPIHVRPELSYYISRMAFLPNAVKLYMHVPWIAEYLIKLNNAIMRDERNSLSEHFKYRLSMLASRENVCTYCTAHHAATLKRRWGYEDELLEKVLNQQGPADEREAVAMEFVEQSSKDANAVTDELRRALPSTSHPRK